MKILLTGVCGFIGMHAAKKLLERGDEVYGIDNINDYYEVSLKEARLAQLRELLGILPPNLELFAAVIEIVGQWLCKRADWPGNDDEREQ